jgi:hypothetical protein
MPSLAAHPCQTQCDWVVTAEHHGPLRVFRCFGCRSEWTSDQDWRPADTHGKVPADVLQEILAHPERPKPST